MFTCHLDTSRAREKLGSLYDATQVDARVLTAWGARQLAARVANFVPPIKSRGRGAKEAGEQAITTELDNLISEARPDLFERATLHSTAAQDLWVTGKDGSKLQLAWQHLAPAESEIAPLHQSYRDHRGKVKIERPQQGKWAARIVTLEGRRQPYMRTVLDRVGTLKAVWGYTVSKLGGRPPQWIARQFPRVASGAVCDVSQLNHPTRPSITFGGRAPGDVRRHAQAATQAQARVFGKLAERILAGHKTSLQAGLKTSAKALHNLDPDIPIE